MVKNGCLGSDEVVRVKCSTYSFLAFKSSCSITSIGVEMIKTNMTWQPDHVHNDASEHIAQKLLA